MENENNISAPSNVPQQVDKNSIISKIFSGRKKWVIFGIILALIISGLVFWYLNSSNNLSKDQAKFYEEMVRSDFAAAQNTAKKALSKSPKNAYMLAGIISAYASEGNQTGTESKTFEKAQPYVKKALETYPNNPQVLHSIGNLYETAGKYEEALEYYNQAIAVDPNNSMAYFHKGHVLQFLNKDDEAYQTYSKSLSLDPNNPFALSLMARREYLDENLEQAYKTYELVNLNKQTPLLLRSEAAVAITSILQVQGRYKDALYVSKQAAERTPDFSPALAAYGSSLLLNNDTDEGIKYLKKAIEANPRITRNYLILGNTYFDFKNYEIAKEYFSNAISASRTDNTLLGIDEKKQAEAQAYVGKAISEYLAGNLAQAQVSLNRAKEIYPNIIEDLTRENDKAGIFEKIKDTPAFDFVIKK